MCCVNMKYDESQKVGNESNKYSCSKEIELGVFPNLPGDATKGNSQINSVAS